MNNTSEILVYPTSVEVSIFIAPQVLERGKEYMEDGRVLEIRQEKGRFRAAVLGSEDQEWTVEIWRVESTGWDGSCTCPYVAGPCKHIAAVMLTMAENPDAVMKGGKTSGQTRRGPVSDEELRAKLHELPREELESILMEQLDRDLRLRQRLELKIRQSRGSPVDLAPYKTQIRQVLTIRGNYIPYGAVSSFISGLDKVQESLTDLASEGHPAEAAQLLEEFIDRCIPLYESVDDSGGSLGSFVRDLYSAWGQALAQVPGRDVNALASNVLKRIQDSEYGIEDDLLQDMSAALGPEGLQIVEEELKKQHAVAKATAKTDEQSGNRRLIRSPGWRTNSLLCNLTDAKGDIEGFITLRQEKGLETSDYKDIAERYRDKGRLQEALDWVDKGLAALSNDDYGRSGLADIKIEILEKLNRREEACKLAWEEYRHASSDTDLERALRLSPETNRDRLRQEAIRKLVEEGELSILIDVCLPAKELGPIVEVIQSQERSFEDLHYSELQPAAQALEKNYSEEAARLYLHLADEILLSKRSAAYHHAVDYFSRVKILWTRLGKKDQWHKLMQTIEKEHGRKSAFMPGFRRLGEVAEK